MPELSAVSVAAAAIAVGVTARLLSRLRDEHAPVQVEGKTVLITGGSQGLGLAAACLLAAKGASVAIAARNPARLEAAREEICKAGDQYRSRPNSKRPQYAAFATDVTTPAANDGLLADVTHWNHGEAPDIVWACAGKSEPGMFVDTSPEVLQRQLGLNYLAAAYLLQSTLRSWLKPVLDREKKSDMTDSDSDGGDSDLAGSSRSRQSRHFIFTSSTVAYFTIAGYSPYSPCKAALRSLCDSVRQELFVYEAAAAADKISGYRPVRLHLVTPGNMDTPGYADENRLKPAVTQMLEESDEAQPAAVVAASVVASIEQGDYLVTTNLLGRLMKASALGLSPRNGLGIVDLLFCWLWSVIAVVVGPYLDWQIFNWESNRRRTIAAGLAGVEPVKGRTGDVDQKPKRATTERPAGMALRPRHENIQA